MKSNQSHSNKLSIDILFNKSSKIYHDLKKNNINYIEDILSIIPSKINHIPSILPFSKIEEDKIFKGVGKIISIKSWRNFKSKRIKKGRLHNINVYIKDYYSDEIISLMYFNCYSNMRKSLETTKYICFIGKPYKKNKKQIINPIIKKVNDPCEIDNYKESEIMIDYPNILGLNSKIINNIISKIPNDIWNKISDPLPKEIITKNNLISLKDSWKIIHGKKKYNDTEYEKAKERLIYQELFEEQLRVISRKEAKKETYAEKIIISDKKFNKLLNIFQYKLTKDQYHSLLEIREDLSSSYQMSRLIQGDVGCGKTSVALISSLIVINCKYQVALMCPTESLAIQHFMTINDVLNNNYNIEIILGGTKLKDKKNIYERLRNGDIDLIIGTHALIQEQIEFKKLGLIIIDEQHRFGVNQRLKLTEKTKNCHSLIMTATPIPRSLSMIQYGDLDISLIKTLPSKKKPIKTKIITPKNFDKFLNFINTRMSLGEQVYIVVCAINKSENKDLLDLKYVEDKFVKFFPDKRIKTLHGQMKLAEKSEALMNFQEYKYDILISTSVIEVGINIPNATTIAIINPERFGLSSLHQLRGRVGRCGSPGFCFLIVDKNIQSNTLERLKIIEEMEDGFEISEKDLEIRGRGDIFGKIQSGNNYSRISNIVTDKEYLIKARNDIEELINNNNQFIINKLNKLKQHSIIRNTT